MHIWPNTASRPSRKRTIRRRRLRLAPRPRKPLPMSADTVADAALPSVELLLPATWNRLDLDPRTRTASIARLADRTMQPGAAFAEARARMRAEFEKAAEIGAASGAVLAFVHWSATDGKLASASLFVALIDAT